MYVIYDDYLQIKRIKLKTKDIESSWITIGIKNNQSISSACMKNS